MTGKSDIPEELLAEMTPAVRAFVEALFARISALEERIDVLQQASELQRVQKEESLHSITEASAIDGSFHEF